MDFERYTALCNPRPYLIGFIVSFIKKMPVRTFCGLQLLLKVSKNQEQLELNLVTNQTDDLTGIDLTM